MRKILLGAALATLMPATAASHHGWSAYDAKTLIRATGRLQNVSWTQPHGTAKIVYQGKLWDATLAPIARMEARGLSRALVSKGPVTLVGHPRRDGTREMKINQIIVGGKTVELR